MYITKLVDEKIPHEIKCLHVGSIFYVNVDSQSNPEVIYYYIVDATKFMYYDKSWIKLGEFGRSMSPNAYNMVSVYFTRHLHDFKGVYNLEPCEYVRDTNPKDRLSDKIVVRFSDGTEKEIPTEEFMFPLRLGNIQK